MLPKMACILMKTNIHMICTFFKGLPFLFICVHTSLASEALEVNLEKRHAH